MVKKVLDLLWNRKLWPVAALAFMTASQSVLAGDLNNTLCPLQNATMKGTYVTQGTGTVIGVGPITTVGMVVYNGDGTGVLVFSTASVNGATHTSSNVPAAFTVNQDCTGSKTIGTTHFNFVISPDGGTITWIVTDAGVSASGTGIRQRP